MPSSARIVLLLAAFAASATNGQFMLEVFEMSRLGVARTVQRCEATGANFGADAVSFSLGGESYGCAAQTDPTTACGPVTLSHRSANLSCASMFAVVPRGNCSFSEKAYNIQKGGGGNLFRAAIIYNYRGEAPFPMDGKEHAEDVTIPTLMVSYSCAASVLQEFPAERGYFVQIRLSPSYDNLFRYLIPFVAVVGFCFIVLLVSLLIRIYRERRRQSRKRLSKKHLRKIPTRKYRKGDEPDTCAICLDEFVEGDKLRVLHCRHAYHCKCIDPWLTQNRKVCPMCKRRVGQRNTDSDEDGPNSPTTSRYQQPGPSTADTSVVSLPRAVASDLEHGSTSRVVVADVHRSAPPPSSGGGGGGGDLTETEDFIYEETATEDEGGGTGHSIVTANNDHTAAAQTPSPSSANALRRHLRSLLTRFTSRIPPSSGSDGALIGADELLTDESADQISGQHNPAFQPDPNEGSSVSDLHQAPMNV